MHLSQQLYSVQPPGAAVDTNNGSITLSWEGNDPDEGDSLTYTIYFDEVDGLQDPIEEDSSETELEVSVESGTTYYWRVKTSDGKSSSFTLVYSYCKLGVKINSQNILIKRNIVLF